MPEQHALTHSPESLTTSLSGCMNGWRSRLRSLRGKLRPLSRCMSAFRNSKHVWLRIATTPAGHHPRTLCSRSHHHVRGTNPAGASPVDNRVGAASPTPWSMTPTKCVIIPLPGTCAGGRGGTGIATTGLAERRQVVEVVIQREVIEYRIVSGTCACGRVQRSTFPAGICSVHDSISAAALPVHRRGAQ